MRSKDLEEKERKRDAIRYEGKKDDRDREREGRCVE